MLATAVGIAATKGTASGPGTCEVVEVVLLALTSRQIWGGRRQGRAEGKGQGAGGVGQARGAGSGEAGAGAGEAGADASWM